MDDDDFNNLCFVPEGEHFKDNLVIDDTRHSVIDLSPDDVIRLLYYQLESRDDAMRWYTCNSCKLTLWDFPQLH